MGNFIYFQIVLENPKYYQFCANTFQEICDKYNVLSEKICLIKLTSNYLQGFHQHRLLVSKMFASYELFIIINHTFLVRYHIMKCLQRYYLILYMYFAHLNGKEIVMRFKITVYKSLHLF